MGKHNETVSFYKQVFSNYIAIFYSSASPLLNRIIEDVIVTAEKRSESIQDISQSVSAITDSI